MLSRKKRQPNRATTWDFLIPCAFRFEFLNPCCMSACAEIVTRIYIKVKVRIIRLYLEFLFVRIFANFSIFLILHDVPKMFSRSSSRVHKHPQQSISD